MKKIICFVLFLTACKSSANNAASSGSSGGTATDTASIAASCSTNPFLSGLGKKHLLVGFSGEDTTASAAAFDLRYVYLSAGVPNGAGPCPSCASNCSVGTQDCSNKAGGCAWWGCYQYDQNPPGEYVRDFVSNAKAAGEIPMFTYYEILQTAYGKYKNFQEGTQEVTIAAADKDLMTAYFADFRFLLQQIGTDVALVHHEPDFWGYAEQVNLDPTQIPAAIASANPTDCGSQPNTIAGLGACLVAMTRTYAPNAKIALHASGWASKMDVLGNSSASLDVAGEAAKTVGFLKAAAPDADFVVSDISDRDAGYYKVIKNENTGWDAGNSTLPNFHQGWAFGKAVSDGLSKPLVWWQVPVGNARLDNSNTCNSDNKPGKFQDNRVDYILENLSELSASGAVGVAFGAGASCCTTPESDGGNLIAKTKTYASANAAASCP